VVVEREEEHRRAGVGQAELRCVLDQTLEGTEGVVVAYKGGLVRLEEGVARAVRLVRQQSPGRLYQPSPLGAELGR
jgi:hypothetical protein